MGGQVEYTVDFTFGTSAVPSYSQLTLTTSGGITAVEPTCTAPAGPVSLNSHITDAILTQKSVAGSAAVTWTCKFRVTVGTSQRAAGEVAPFDVQLSFNTSSSAWFIPKTTTLSVPVWSGAAIRGVTPAVVQTANQFYQGMPGSHATQTCINNAFTYSSPSLLLTILAV